MEGAYQQKQAKYQDLVDEATAAGFSTDLITIEIGSRVEDEFTAVQAAFDATKGRYQHPGIPAHQNYNTRIIQNLVLAKCSSVTSPGTPPPLPFLYLSSFLSHSFVYQLSLLYQVMSSTCFVPFCLWAKGSAQCCCQAFELSLDLTHTSLFLLCPCVYYGPLACYVIQ